MTQNVRGLPDTSRDAYGTTAYHADSLDYDANGNVAAITDGATGNGQRGNRTMTYDGLDRLKTVVSPMYGTTGATYTYDVLDNLTRVTIGGTSARDHHYCYDASWRLTNLKTSSCTGTTVVGLGYDVQGNLQNRNGRTYEFDYGNRLRSVAADTANGAPASTYVYDAHGRRVRDRVPTSKHSHYLHNGQLSMTSDGRRNIVAEYIYLAGSLIAIRERDTVTNVYTTKYQHTDALGSPVVVTDQNRTVLERSEYEPCGNVLSPANPVDGPGYTGHVYDSATGLNYMQQRYYDPLIGRFLSVDPVTADGNTGDNFNRYWYANNNPYKFTDPDGRIGKLIVEIVKRVLPRVLPKVAPKAAPKTAPRTAPRSEPRQAAPRPESKPSDSSQSGNRFPDRELPRDKHGNPKPDPDANGPHTQLGQKDGRNGRYDQAREFDGNGKPVKDVDFTDHGRPGQHTNPHEHPYVPNPTGGTPMRGTERPLNGG